MLRIHSTNIATFTSKNTNKNTRHLSPHTEVDHISSYIKENTADPMMTSGSIESL